MCRSATPLVTVVVVAATTTALDEIGANIEDQQGHAFDQPSGNANPLLIAAGEGPHLLFRSAGADAERLDPMTRLLGLGGFGDKQSLGRRAGGRCQRHNVNDLGSLGLRV